MSVEQPNNNHSDEIYDFLSASQQSDHLDAYELAWRAHSNFLDALDDARGMAGDSRDADESHDHINKTNKTYFREDYADYDNYRKAAELLMPPRGVYYPEEDVEIEAAGLTEPDGPPVIVEDNGWHKLRENMRIDDLGALGFYTYNALIKAGITSVNALTSKTVSDLVELPEMSNIADRRYIENIKNVLNEYGLRLMPEPDVQFEEASF